MNQLMTDPVDIATLRAAHSDHWTKATAIRALALDAVAAANSGHSGMPIGMADVATVLFRNHLKFDAAAPDWPDRDRFILSAGHGSMLLYALLYLTGYAAYHPGRNKEFPPVGIEDRGAPGEFSGPRNRNHHRSAGPGARAIPSASPLPKKSCARSSARRSWTTTPMSSRATAA